MIKELSNVHLKIALVYVRIAKKEERTSNYVPAAFRGKEKARLSSIHILIYLINIIITS